MALGANLGDPAATLRGAAVALSGLGVLARRSRLFRTRPVGGPVGQADYLNAVVVVHPAAAFCEPRAFLDGLLAIEASFGRERRERWAARTLDLDLLALGGIVRDESGLVLPHPRMMERPFVLVPLLDVAPAWRHPVTGRSARDALAERGSAGVQPSEDGWDGG